MQVNILPKLKKTVHEIVKKGFGLKRFKKGRTTVTEANMHARIVRLIQLLTIATS